MKTPSLFLKIPLYNLFYYTGYFRPLPLSYTIALTYRCNCRCLTCRIYENEASAQEEISCKEYNRLFSNLGESPYWVTFTGGEPFLRKDTIDIVGSLYKICKPRVVNIATNGMLTESIVDSLNKILNLCRDSYLILNLSIDDINDKHDIIRGVPGSYNKVLNTYRELRSIRKKNFILGINTVISRYNVERFPQIYEEIRALNPDSYVTEIAQEREELNNLGLNITPPYEAYARAISYMENKRMPFVDKSLGNIIWNARLRYHDTVKHFLQNKTHNLRCFAGTNSCYISPYGNVSFCCIYISPVGNLREIGYNFKKLWFSFKAKEKRETLKKKKCACTLANIFYTNLIFNVKEIFHIIRNIYKDKR